MEDMHARLSRRGIVVRFHVLSAEGAIIGCLLSGARLYSDLLCLILVAMYISKAQD